MPSKTTSKMGTIRLSGHLFSPGVQAVSAWRDLGCRSDAVVRRQSATTTPERDLPDHNNARLPVCGEHDGGFCLTPETVQ